MDYEKAHETSWSRELASHYDATDPHNEVIIAPTRYRAETNGLILRYEYILTERGDTKKVDITFSISKSYLYTTAGTAFDPGLIQEVHDKTKDSLDDVRL